MKFVKTEELKKGMRLARPIFNRDGTLLYDRDSKITEQGIRSIENFDLIGIYILEPGEPLPPWTEADFAFEAFQAAKVLAILDEFTYIFKNSKRDKMDAIAGSVVEKFGLSGRKVNFVQNLRSKKDYVAKHSLNVAILCALMSNVLKVSPIEKISLMQAALMHDIGKTRMPEKFIGKEKFMTEEDNTVISVYADKGIDVIGVIYADKPEVKNIVIQFFRVLESFYSGKDVPFSKLPLAVRIFVAAEVFDTYTAMNEYDKPTSDIAALKYMLERVSFFGENIMEALIGSINFLTEGCCIELSNGKTGLVLARNNTDVLKPRVLCFEDNRIIELSNAQKGERLEIKDAMKSIDNRYVIDRETWEEYARLLELKETE